MRSKPDYCQPAWFQRFLVAWLIMLAQRWLASTSRAVPPLSPSCTTANQAGFRGSLWLGSSRWKEVTCFHCKSCASIRLGCAIANQTGLLSLQELCFLSVQATLLPTRLVSEVVCCLAAWLIMLVRIHLLSLQEPCFCWVQATLLPTRLVSELLCGLAVDMKWLAFTSRAVRPLDPSCTLANQTRFRGSLWLGSSCW